MVIIMSLGILKGHIGNILYIKNDFINQNFHIFCRKHFTLLLMNGILYYIILKTGGHWDGKKKSRREKL